MRQCPRLSQTEKVAFADASRAHHNTIELCKDCCVQEYVRDCRFVQNRTMLHKCGSSCYKYSQDGVRICRHQVYHLISFRAGHGGEAQTNP